MSRTAFHLISLVGSLNLAAAEPTVVEVHPGKARQEFQGMGCGAIFYEAHVTSLGANGLAAQQERLYDDLFTKVRTDFLQLQIRHDHEPANDNADPYTQAFDPKNFADCEHPLKISAAARKRNPAMKLYAVLYTPPVWMKTNNAPGGGGKDKATVKPGLELEIGEYIWAFLAHMQKNGQPVDYLSISNEADWGHDQPGYFLTTEQQATKIYHGFRQWCAPLVPGMRVVDTRVSGPFASDIAKPGIKASSFLSADGRKLVVHVAAVQDPDTDIVIQIAPPFENGLVRMWRTGKDEDFIELPAARITDGRISTRLPGRGLLTLSLEKPAP